jgi:mRNA interferase ChpB
MKNINIPERGDIWFVCLNPSLGTEQQGIRPIFVISNKLFNQTGLALVCPITQGGNQSRFAGFAVSLTGTGLQTNGIILCNQIRTIDYRAREASFVEKAPLYITDDVLAKVQAIIN